MTSQRERVEEIQQEYERGGQDIDWHNEAVRDLLTALATLRAEGEDLQKAHAHQHATIVGLRNEVAGLKAEGEAKQMAVENLERVRQRLVAEGKARERELARFNPPPGVSTVATFEDAYAIINGLLDSRRKLTRALDAARELANLHQPHQQDPTCLLCCLRATLDGPGEGKG